MKTTTLTTADGREIRVHHAEDWSGQARLRFAPDSNQGDIHLPGWVARGLCRREPQCCADSRANLLARAEQAERELADAKAKLAEAERARDAEVNAHDKLDDLAVAYARERDEAREQRDALGRRVEDTQRALNESAAGFAGMQEAARVRALRARLAKAEAVVSAARAAITEMWRLSESSLLRPKLHAVADALRALDEDKET